MGRTKARLKAWAIVILSAGAICAYAMFKFPRYKESPSIGPERSFSVSEVSNETGVGNLHTSFTTSANLAHVEPFISSIGASVAVVDFDNDSHPDIFFNSSATAGANRLFKNLGNGKFQEITSEVGLGNLSESPLYRTVFFDCDSDGFRDLFAFGKCPIVYRNLKGKKFEKISDQAGISCDPADMISAVHAQDLFQSGRMDLITAPLTHFPDRYYDGNIMGFKSTKVMPENFTEAVKGSGKMRVYRNLGECRFEEVDVGIDHKAWTHAIGIQHVGDKKVIWFASDFSFDHAYKEVRPGEYKAFSEKIRGIVSHNGMSVEFSYIDDEPWPAVFISQIFETREYPAGNTLWKWKSADQLEFAGQERGVYRCGWAWGAKFADIDNSGREDLIITNGQISGEPGKGDNYYNLSVLAGASKEFTSDAKNWPSIRGKSQSGFQQDCILLNKGNGHFETVDVPQFDSELRDGRGLAVLDYKSNGNIAAVVANQKQPTSFYQFTPQPKNSWIGFSLKATRTQWEAWGSRVEIQTSNGTFRKELQPLNGYASQSDARLHFGLGENPKIRKISVHWPGGQIQEINDYKVNAYNSIVERSARE